MTALSPNHYTGKVYPYTHNCRECGKEMPDFRLTSEGQPVGLDYYGPWCGIECVGKAMADA